MRFVIVLVLIESAPIVAVKVEFAAGIKLLYLYNYIPNQQRAAPFRAYARGEGYKFHINEVQSRCSWVLGSKGITFLALGQ